MDKELDPQDAFPHLQYSRGAFIRCAKCRCPRKLIETVVADGRRICKDVVDCVKLVEAQRQGAVATAPVAPSKRSKKLPEPSKREREQTETPEFWNGMNPFPI